MSSIPQPDLKKKVFPPLPTANRNGKPDCFDLWSERARVDFRERLARRLGEKSWEIHSPPIPDQGTTFFRVPRGNKNFAPFKALLILEHYFPTYQILPYAFTGSLYSNNCKVPFSCKISHVTSLPLLSSGDSPIQSGRPPPFPNPIGKSLYAPLPIP